MERGSTGSLVSIGSGREAVRAFLPAPLPPEPPLQLDGPLQPLLEAATLAVGRLDSVSALLPDAGLFLYSYVRKEAVLSSRIEGTRSSLSDLLLLELEEAPGAPLDDTVEVSNLSRTRRRQGAGRIPPLAELDRRRQAGQCRVRAAAAHIRARLHGGARALSPWR